MILSSATVVCMSGAVDALMIEVRWMSPWCTERKSESYLLPAISLSPAALNATIQSLHGLKFLRYHVNDKYFSHHTTFLCHMSVINSNTATITAVHCKNTFLNQYFCLVFKYKCPNIIKARSIIGNLRVNKLKSKRNKYKWII